MNEFEIGDEVFVIFGGCRFEMTVVEFGNALVTLRKDQTTIVTPRSNLAHVDPANRLITLSDFLD